MTALLALIALLALRYRFSGCIALVWFCVGSGLIDTIYAVVQSLRSSVFNYALGANWVIVTCYLPALLVSSLLIFLHLLSASPRRIPHAVTTA